MTREILDLSRSKPPKDWTPGPVLTLTSISIDTFFDPDFETDPRWSTGTAGITEVLLRDRLGDTEGAIRASKGLTKQSQGQVLCQLTFQRARRGDTNGALAVANSIESPRDRLLAFKLMGMAVGDRDTRK